MYLFPQLKNKFTTKENYGNKKNPIYSFVPLHRLQFHLGTW